MPRKAEVNNDKGAVPPIKIGVTGGIGAGKSLVCRIFSALGTPVYNADSQARKLMVTDSTLIGQIKGHFGAEAYTADGNVNRTYLAEKAFGDPEKLALLNSLVHPRVALDFERWIQEHSTFQYVIKEAALIFESGSHKGLDAVVAVSAPEELRIRRTIIRDEHRNRKQVEDIIKKQLPEEERLQKANYKVVNDEKNMLIPQVLKLHKAFLAGKV